MNVSHWGHCNSFHSKDNSNSDSLGPISLLEGIPAMQTNDFLTQIRDNPDDDIPRLVYADWLEETGDTDRAEFIRVQCELQTRNIPKKRRELLRQREGELLETHGWDWAEPYGEEISEWQFERGFIERIHMNLETSKNHILKVLQKGPIRHIRDTNQFCDLSGFVDALPHLEHLTGLELWNLYAFEDELVREILQSPHLKNLKMLVLHHDRNGNLVDENVIAEGMLSQYRSNIEELSVNVDCSWRGPSNVILNAIADSPYLRKLRRLDMSNAGDAGNDPQLTVDTIDRLAKSRNLKHLEVLDLRNVHATKEVWKWILKMPQLQQLKRLYLGDACEIPEGEEWIPIVGTLSEMPRWRNQFEKLVVEVDWEQRFIDPYFGGVWKGISWDQRRQQLLFAMSPYLKSRDYDGLEARYREVCLEYGTKSIAEKIDKLPFDSWGREFKMPLTEMIETAENRSAETIFLRVRPDIDWSGNLGVHDTYEPSDFGLETTNPDEPFEEFSYGPPEVERESPAFDQAATIFKKHHLNSGTNPSGPSLYLLARTVATFGRCLNQFEISQRVFFSCMWAVFRMR